MHLQNCPDCQAELAGIAKLNLLLDSLGDCSVTEGFHTEVMAALERPAAGAARDNEAGKSAWFRFSLAGDLVAAAAAALVIFWAGGFWFTPKYDVINRSVNHLAQSYVQVSSGAIDRVVISTGSIAEKLFQKEGNQK